MSAPRFIVVYATNAAELQERLSGYHNYEVKKMTASPWFENNQNDNSLCQTADSLYVLLERKEAQHG